MQQPLTQRERFLILALMVHEPPTDVTNTDLKANYGLDIKSGEREKLSEAGYLASFRDRGPGKPYLYELTPKGRQRAAEELSGSADPKSVPNLRVVYALFNAVHRFLNRNHLPAEAIFNADRISTDAEALDTDISDALTKEYRSLAERPASWVPLRRLREALPAVARGDLDDALRLLYRSRVIRLTSEANRRTLSEADTAAALNIGGDDLHWLAIA